MKQQNWFTKIEYALHYSVPVVITAIFCLLMILPMNLPLSAAIMPNLFLISIFYWSLYRPSLLPLTAVFILGLFLDIYNGEYLGTNALLGILTYAVMYQQRSFILPLNFTMIWSIFATTMLVIGLISAVVHSAYTDTSIDFVSLTFKVALTALLYPVFSTVLTKLDQMIAETAE